jgi:hypothetical protein
MRVVRALLMILVLAGCSHSAAVITNAQPTAPVPGVNATGAIAAAVLIGVAVVATSQEVTDVQPTPSTAAFSDWSPRVVPAMAPERVIVEQDCTQPLDLSGNLRCR